MDRSLSGLRSYLFTISLLAAFVAVLPLFGGLVWLLTAPAEELVAARGQAGLMAVGVAAWAMLVGFVACSLLARGLLGPLAALRSAADDLAAGHFDGALIPSRSSQLADVTRSFARMAEVVRSTYTSLEAERDRLDAVLGHMADGILIVNAEMVITLANPSAQKAIGTAVEPLVGQRLAAVVHEHEIIALARECLSAGEAGRDYATTVERAVPRRYLRLLATRLGEGRDAQALLVLQDLTELRRVEVMRRDFLANVSHELRTPLAALKAMVETLQDGAMDDPEAARDFLSRIDDETESLALLVEELLQLSRIESGATALRREPVDADELLSSAARRLAPLAERAGVRLQIEPSESDLVVLADRERLGQVLVNLLHNAVKFTPPGGSVTLTAQPAGRLVRFSVNDTGAGILPDDLNRLFERFYKADKARASRGTGLGLAIAKHLVQAHGGKIWAESAGPGQGASFHVTIPAAGPASPR